MTPYQRLFNTFLVHTDPEHAHEQAFRAIRTAAPVLSLAPTPGSPVTAMGLTFPNAFGLAAGFDKNGVGIDALGALGFGHVEIGTVTAEPQPGNPQPRLFRLVADKAIVNRMGFNNDGAAAVAARLARRSSGASAARWSSGGSAARWSSGASAARWSSSASAARWSSSAKRVSRPILGINIGKTKVVPEDDVAAVKADYAKSAGLLAPYADYLVVNVSSPNTPGLRSLQAIDRLQPLLETVRSEAGAVPLLVKIAPDLADEDVLDVAEMALAIGLDGIIATNTTIARTGLRSHPSEVEDIGPGGLSGRPLRGRSLDVLRLLRDRVADRMTLIGVGGISTVADAQERLDAGATLVQGYTGFIYEGPLWPRRIAGGLR